MDTEEKLRIKKRRLFRDFIIIIVSVLIAIYIQSSDISKSLISLFGGLNFIPVAILMGFLFSLTFTAAISTSVFILLAESVHNPYLVALLGGIGSVMANLIIYKFFEKELLSDLELLEPKSAKKTTHRIFHSRLFIGIVPYLAALVFLSPLPDEVGMLVLRGANLKRRDIFLLSFAFHTIGILLIILLGSALI